MNLEGKIAVITGSSKGIGLAIAYELGGQGVKVVINSRNSEEGLTAERELRQIGIEAKYVQADVSKETDVKSLFKAVKDTYGRLDILVCNAGIYIPHAKTSRDYDAIHSVNGKGVYLCCDNVADYMEKGKIVIISSIWGIKPNPRSAISSGVKAEVEAYKSCFAKFYAPNIQVNSVAPGWTDTPMVRNNFTYDSIAAAAKMTINGRIRSADEIAKAVRFLIENDGITGQTIIVDGGSEL